MSGPGQILANALMEIEYSLPLLAKNPQKAVSGLNALRDELREGLAQLQNYVAELEPPLLEEMGLAASINKYLENFGKRTGMVTECRGCEQFRERYPMTIEIALFRILQEALINVETHAHATNVSVHLAHRAAAIHMTVHDNGHGFAPRPNTMSKKRQLGLVAMRDRAELLGGQLQMFSEAGKGVRVVVTIPYHGHNGEQTAKASGAQQTAGEAVDEVEIKQGGGEDYDRTNHKRPRKGRTGSAKKSKSGSRRVESGTR